MGDSLKQFAALLLRINEKQSTFIGQVVDSKKVPEKIRNQAFDLQAEIIIALNTFDHISDDIRPVALNQELLDSLTNAASVIRIIESGMRHSASSIRPEFVEQMQVCLRRLAAIGVTPDDASERVGATRAQKREANHG